MSPFSSLLFLHTSASSLALPLLLFCPMCLLLWFGSRLFLQCRRSKWSQKRQGEYLLVPKKSLRRLLRQLLAILLPPWIPTQSRGQSLFFHLKGTVLARVLVIRIHLPQVRVSKLLLPPLLVLKIMSLSLLVRWESAYGGGAILRVFREPHQGSVLTLIFLWYQLDQLPHESSLVMSQRAPWICDTPNYTLKV